MYELVISHNHLYKKLGEFGKDYNEKVKEMVDTDTKWLAKKVSKESKLPGRT